MIVGLLALVTMLLGPERAEAKPCRSMCGGDIATCQATCDGQTRGARRRCRKACKRAVIAECRQYDGTSCVAPREPDPSNPTDPSDPSDPSDPTDPPPFATGFIPVVHLTSSGVDRTYSLFVPTSYDPAHAYPLVFAFHGDGGSGAVLRGYIGVEEQANGAAIFVYPDATDESGRHWTLDASLDANPDMRLFLDMIDHVAATYTVDRSRVFATGHSSGGFFVNFLNCTLGSAYLRAIAPHGGSGPYGNDWDYDVDGHFMCNADPAAAILIHGANDDVVPLADASYSHQQWVFENGCAKSIMSGPSPAPCVTHPGCDDGKPVDWCVVAGIGHGWWSQAPQAIWGFFARFLEPVAPPAAGGTMHVVGRNLYDADGERVLLRGVNKMNVFDPTDQDGHVSFPQMHAAGANTVRIVWMTQTEFFVPTAQDLDEVIGNAIANHLIPMIELHDATGNLGLVGALVDYWTRPDIAAVLRKHERFLLVNVANEAGDWQTTAEQFAATYLDAIARLRAAGIRSPLVIDAPDSGKNIDAVFATAAQLIAADPDHNLLFSVHIYWAISWGMGADYIWWKLGNAVDTDVPLVVGEFSQYGAWTANDVSICAPAGEVDYKTVLHATHAYGIGWYAWEWGPGNGYNDPKCAIMDMTTNNQLATLQPGWATDVVYGAHGLSETSVIPASLQ
jgi:mannan endo-1,4-beta-mannosidase